MINRIDHIGIAVQSIEQTMKIYTEKLKLKCGEITQIPEQKVKVASFEIGESGIELIEPTTQESTVARFLEKRGEGIHHIAFEVTDLEKRLNELKNNGTTLIDEKPRTGAYSKKIAFIHPKETNGILIELVEKST